MSGRDDLLVLFGPAKRHPLHTDEQFAFYRDPREPPIRTCHYETVSALNGRDGATPDPRKEPISEAKAGEAGTAEKAGLDLDPSIPFIEPLYLEMIVRSAERLYREGQHDAALKRLGWAVQAGKAANVSTRQFFNGEDAKDNRRVALAVQRSETLLERQRLGLNYYGRHYDFVPLLSLASYSSAIDPLMQIGKNIENSYLIYRSAGKSNLERLGALSQAESNTQNALKMLGEQDRTLHTAQLETRNNIQALLTELASLWQELDHANIAFKNAVARRAGCGFGDVIKAGAAIAAIASGGGAVFAGLSAAYAAFSAKELKDENGNPITDEWKQLEFRVQKFEPVVAGGQKIADAYGKLKDILNKPHPDIPQLPSDDAKIIADRAEFERQIAPYLGLSEAQNYRRLMDQYIGVATRRNNLILEVNAVQLKRAEIKSLVEQGQEDSVRVRSAIARGSNPYLSEYKEYFSRAYSTVRAMISETLYETSRAQAYMAGTDERPSFDERDIASLGLGQARVIQGILSAKNAYAQDALPFGNLQLPLSNVLTRQQMKNFLASGSAIFTISEKLPFFARRPMATLDAIEVKLVGHNVPFRALLQQHGSSLLRTKTGDYISYSHEVVRTIFEKDAAGRILSNGRLVAPNSEFAGVSPFAVWSIVVEGDKLAPSRLRDVVLTLSGKSYVS